jgi:glutamate racemase
VTIHVAQTDADARPIGVFDSGVGGLTVLKVLAERFPNESFVYLGDTARLPYGSKSPQTIRRYSEQNVHFLLNQNVKGVVIACGSASSQFPELEYEGVSIYNVIHPASRKALSVTQNKHIGVLGTRATVKSGAYTEELSRLDTNVQVFSQACALFVPLAEEGWDEDPITNLVVYRYVHPLTLTGIDTLILGCTHYPILKAAIQRVTGSAIQLVDAGEAIAEQIAGDISLGKISASDSEQVQKIMMMTTDSLDHFKTLAGRILGNVQIHSFQVVDISVQP